MEIKKINTTEAEAIIKALVSDCYKKEMNLKKVHRFTDADINTAGLYLVKGSFTYAKLRAEGVTGNLFILSGMARGTGANSWTNSRAWLVVGDRVELLPCQFPENAFRKSDTEEWRKNPEGLAVVIASPSIRCKDYHREIVRQPQEPKQPDIMDRLREYKRKRSAEALKEYRGTAQDIANAEKVRASLYDLIRENLNKKQGAELLAYCVEVGRCDTAFNWIGRKIETLKEFEANGPGIPLDMWGTLETMKDYQRIIKEIDREALDILRRANA